MNKSLKKKKRKKERKSTWESAMLFGNCLGSQQPTPQREQGKGPRHNHPAASHRTPLSGYSELGRRLTAGTMPVSGGCIVKQTPAQLPASLGDGARGAVIRQAERQALAIRFSQEAPERPAQTAVKRKYEQQLHQVFHKTPHMLLPGQIVF